MIEFLTLFILADITLLILGFIFKEFVFGLISGMLMMAIGVFVGTNGLVGVNNFLSQSVGVILIGIGAYIFIRGTLELIEQF